MGKRKKHQDAPVEDETAPVVNDSDDGSTETAEDEFLGENDPTENDNSDFGV